MGLSLSKSNPKQKRLSAAELAYINSDEDEVLDKANVDKVSWFKLLTYKQTWAFTFGKFMTDGVWWFFLFWLPGYLKDQYGMTGSDIVLPLAVLYSMTMIGSIGGGWLPLRLINKGMVSFKARKTSMLIYAFCVLPIVFAQILGNMNMWFAIIVIGIAAAAHQAWSAVRRHQEHGLGGREVQLSAVSREAGVDAARRRRARHRRAAAVLRERTRGTPCRSARRLPDRPAHCRADP